MHCDALAYWHYAADGGAADRYGPAASYDEVVVLLLYSIERSMAIDCTAQSYYCCCFDPSQEVGFFSFFLFFYSLLFHFLHYPSSSRQRLSVSMGEIINECGNGVSRLSREEAAAVENVVLVVESERGKEKGRFTTLLNSSSSSRSWNTLCQLLFSFSFPFSFCPILLLIALLLLMIDCEH